MISIDDARILYDGAEAAHAFDHVLRVLALAERIAQVEGADLQIVRTAALLHDMARHEPDHHLRGAERARALLNGWPPDQVDAICHAIEAHRFRTGPAPATLEAACLHDADKLDAIGAIGVARAVAFGASLGQRLWSQPLAEIDPRQSPPAGIDYTATHEFVYKLAQLKDRLLTATARAIAHERHQVMATFFQQMDAEVLGMA
jgi:uncharacterized protein